MPSSRVASILRSLSELGEPIRVHGAPPAAQAWIAAKLAALRREAALSVYICPDDDAAFEMASDIQTLANSVGGSEFSVDVCTFPGWEQSPYRPIAPSLRVRLARLAVLARLSGPRAKPLVITTSLGALAQATAPAKEFDNSVIMIEKGDTQDRDAFVAALLRSGYLRTDPVEDPGAFAARGEIVDVFPPGSLYPARLEFFGNEVERIRSFDPKSQRTLSGVPELKSLLVPPAREVLINASTVPRIRAELKARADDLGVPRTTRDPVLHSISDGVYPEHADTWAAFAYEKPGFLLDYLPKDCLLAWADELSSRQNWDELIAEQNRLAAIAHENGVIAPPPEKMYEAPAALDSRLSEKVKLFFDRLEMADLSAADLSTDETDAPGSSPEKTDETPQTNARHRVSVRPNTDLISSNRHSLQDLEPKLKQWLERGFRVVALASTESQLERIRFLLSERNLKVELARGSLSQGFRWPAENLAILTEGEILGAAHVKRKIRDSAGANKDWSGLQALTDLAVGDAVVHIDHGIGRYQGLVRLELSGAPADFLLLEYANRDRLYLPVYRLNVIQRYAGAGEVAPLDKLGGQQFAKTKEKVKDAVKKLAVDLVKLYAERQIRPGVRFSPRDASFREFEAKFPFDETPDQSKAIDDVLNDVQSGKAMDRLVCGDVGYGKTEVAMRAAFRAVSDGKQVAVLVPTTVLAFQHEQSFRQRFKDYPINIESVSRFKGAKEQKEALASLAQGKTDILIGTHRLLSRDVAFRDLGLIIVDEEHRFGVDHKEKLKTLKTNTHVLTLTATPIPRTLHMALSGLRDISLINTPPVDRLPIRTYVSKYDEDLIRRALAFELSRGGQVFFLHNRVQSIEETAARIQEIAPEAVIGIGHGQMGEGELEKAMLAFYEKRTNVLLCTTIIESGLDIPNANTIIILRADTLGLAQLYQIRGRVGRGQARAYAYLLIPAEGAMTEDAKKRLEVIQRFVELGSGFSIASHDLEIRGGGDLLGPQQSGHIAAVGFDLYTELLEEAVSELQGKEHEESSREPEIKAPFPAFLSEIYVPDVHQRLSLYRRLSSAPDEAALVSLEEEMQDRFGPLPAEASGLFWLIRIKQLLKAARIDALTVGPERVSVIPGPGGKIDPARVVALLSAHPSRYQLTPDSKLIVKIPTASFRDAYFGTEALLKSLAGPV